MAYHLRGDSLLDDEEVKEHDEWSWSLMPLLLVVVGGVVVAPLPLKIAAAVVGGPALCLLWISRTLRCFVAFATKCILVVTIIVVALAAVA